jgi:hypothetical protein
MRRTRGHVSRRGSSLYEQRQQFRRFCFEIGREETQLHRPNVTTQRCSSKISGRIVFKTEKKCNNQVLHNVDLFPFSTKILSITEMFYKVQPHIR